MAAALMPKLFFHLPSRLCFTPIGRLPTLSSNFISSVFQKRKATTLPSDQNTRESGRKHDRDRRSYFPISWLVSGTLYLSNSSTANCVGEDSGCEGSGSSPSEFSEEEQKQKQTTTPTTSGFPLRDISGRFSSSSKNICAANKATQLQNIRAKRKLVLDSDDENPQEVKKITRSSLVSLLFHCIFSLQM